MKRKIFIAAAVLTAMLTCTACSDNSEIKSQLNEVRIENKLPAVNDAGYTSAEDAENAVYEQQIAACEMLNDAYDKTYYTQYLRNESGKQKSVIESCNEKRIEINKDIAKRYKSNIYTIMAEVEGINVSAYVERTYNDVLTFHDAYGRYQKAENKDIPITDILVYYYDRTNVLAKSFLIHNEEEVFDAAVSVVEGNAQTDEDYRFYLNKNNNIVKALNNVFGGVPEKYASKMNDANKKLARNLFESFGDLTEREKKQYMEELGLTTPSPTPKPTNTPAPATPLPTPRPLVTPLPTPKPTPKPTTTPAPSASQQPQPTQQIIELD